jgi:hypothetical protein
MCVLVTACVTTIAAQEPWLPSQIEQGLADQLAERLTAVDPGKTPDQAAIRQAAVRAVQAAARQLGAWTDRVAVEKAPVFPQINWVKATERHLDAMGRFQVCNLTLFPQFESGSDPGSRRAGALGLTAITMAIVRLRQPFLAAGGNHDAIEAFLTSAAMAAVLEDVQKQAALQAHVKTQCAPVLRELLGTPSK